MPLKRRDKGIVPPYADTTSDDEESEDERVPQTFFNPGTHSQEVPMQHPLQWPRQHPFQWPMQHSLQPPMQMQRPLQWQIQQPLQPPVQHPLQSSMQQPLRPLQQPPVQQPLRPLQQPMQHSYAAQLAAQIALRPAFLPPETIRKAPIHKGGSSSTSQSSSHSHGSDSSSASCSTTSSSTQKGRTQQRLKLHELGPTNRLPIHLEGALFIVDRYHPKVKNNDDVLCEIDIIMRNNWEGVTWKNKKVPEEFYDSWWLSFNRQFSYPANQSGAIRARFNYIVNEKLTCMMNDERRGLEDKPKKKLGRTQTEGILRNNIASNSKFEKASKVNQKKQFALGHITTDYTKQIAREEVLKEMNGLIETCRHLFGDDSRIWPHDATQQALRHMERPDYKSRLPRFSELSLEDPGIVRQRAATRVQTGEHVPSGPSDAELWEIWRRQNEELMELCRFQNKEMVQACEFNWIFARVLEKVMEDEVSATALPEQHAAMHLLRQIFIEAQREASERCTSSAMRSQYLDSQDVRTRNLDAGPSGSAPPADVNRPRLDDIATNMHEVVHDESRVQRYFTPLTKACIAHLQAQRSGGGSTCRGRSGSRGLNGGPGRISRGR